MRKIYKLLLLTYLCSYAHFAYPVDVIAANQAAEAQCATIDPGSEKAILCAIWANSRPVVPVHKETGRIELKCSGVDCAKQTATSACQELGFKTATGYKEEQVEINHVPIRDGEPATDIVKTMLTALWCQ